MADLNQMKAEAARQGATPPPDYPGGPDAWVQDWYANAKAAGSIPSERPANYAGPQDAEAQGYNYSAGVSGGSGWQPGQGITPQQLRQLSREQGWSEDFNRFSDAQLQAWIDQSWDPNSGRFRSEGGGGALVEKPTECPPGTTLHGSKCVSWNQLPFELGGTATSAPMGAQAAVQAGPAKQSTGDPLQDALIGMYQERGHIFGGSDAGEALQSGGIWWGSSGQPLSMPPAQQSAVATQTPAPPQPQAPVSSGSGFAAHKPGGLESSMAEVSIHAPQQKSPQSSLEAALSDQMKKKPWWKEAPDESRGPLTI